MRFSDDARIVIDRFALATQLSKKDLATLLDEAGRDRFAADRVWNELQYVGIATAHGGKLTKLNDLFWNYHSIYQPTYRASDTEREVWSLIEETETTLRSLVFSRYESEWPGRTLEKMQEILGAEWAKIQEIKRKSDSAYRFSADHRRDLMDCMYIGQVANLILSRKAWHLFSGVFRDKRELEDWLRGIQPVRNDRAHFAPVPEKELLRCRVACDDLLVVIQNASQ
jgi:hypothetical protein